MKIKLSLINVSFIILLTGLLCTIGIGMQAGAIIILIASGLILSIFIIQIFQSIKKKKLWNIDNLMYTTTILILAVIFIHDFSVSIAMPFLGNVPGFGSVYLTSGVLLIILFLSASIRLVSKVGNSKKRSLLITIFSIVSAISVLGLIGMAGIIPLSGWLITHSLIFLALFYFILFVSLLLSGNKANKAESLTLVILSGAMLFFMVVRFKFPQLLPQGLINSIVSFGFIPIIILPLSILVIKRFHFFTVFVFYFILLDFYFIHTNRNFNYLVTVGLGGCEGYENATTYPINTDPGVPIEDLMRGPTENELSTILTEWKRKDFTPSQIQIEFSEVRSNGDSIKVVSHLVNGQKHYGLIRIPKGINISNAPILLGLMGGGTGIDVLKTSDLNRLSSGRCRGLLDNYISIMPSFRGNILRGEDFCFRSEGYSGDVWLGAAEDAVAFLEAVKFLYDKSDKTKTIATGISRGATVALIIGGMTDKLDYIIANSTHTKFLDLHVVNNERVGGSYSRVFYTPKASPEEIRKRLITSSPYYFANNLPAFEIHQGTEDQKTSVWHARILENRLKEFDRNDSTYNIYIHDGKGHAYDDDEIVCASLSRFLEK
ncbi:prolyl oligopeptidase family serine peptidase [Marivirga sp.]|uniref:prolyl oligopeptidase family serine peptidase n=1 Tax=Marivirga sp. TaxID=2018662 RepID=UPI0025F97867|nr:prolyl oligopeptidase family serine peptidase [Marivirga sp.]